MKTIASKFLLYIFEISIILISIIPFLVLLQIALNAPSDLLHRGFLTLPNFTAANLISAWDKTRLYRAMLNSAVITICAVGLTLFSAASASYAISRFPNLFNRVLYKTFIFSMAIPGIISTVPLYVLMRRLGAINTLWGMVLLDTTSSLPFAIFLYVNFIKSLSREMEEAAIIDGCSWFSAFWRILFPLLKPVTITVVLLNTIFYWNEYGRAVFFLQKQDLYTVPLAISMFVQKYGAQWELMASGALIAMIPAILVFLMFQKYYIKGLASGAVKG